MPSRPPPDISTLPHAGLQQDTEQRDCEFLVEVIEGPDVGRKLTASSSAPAPALVGTSPVCDLQVTDRRVSRRHLALEPRGDVLRLRDLASTNGTVVQGLQVNDAALRGGEVIRIGETALTVRKLAAEEPSVTAMMRFGAMIGGSFEMRRLYPLCERLAASAVPLVIEGETGTGKEVLAEAIHQSGPRSGGPFVVFDCTAVAANLIESALFGHERGAFTGALSARRGVFEAAKGGTLLIDEIGDLPLALQAKLLRVIERQEVQRVGGNRWLRVDVRVIAATRRNLDEEVQAGRFRDDLFFRIAVTRIELPPLRRRTGDIGVLARHFWRALGGEGAAPPDDFVRRLESYSWPGNVRELQNTVARRISLGALDVAEPARASESIPPPEAPDDVIERILERALPFPRARDQMLAEFEKRYVERLLDRHGGNVTRAAAASGVALRYFQLIRARQAGS